MTNQDKLKECLSNFTGFIAVRMQVDESGRGKGFAHADFDNLENANTLVNKKDLMLDDRVIKTELSNQKART